VHQPPSAAKIKTTRRLAHTFSAGMMPLGAVSGDARIGRHQGADGWRSRVSARPWPSPRPSSSPLDHATRGLDYLRSTVKRIIRAAELRDKLSFTSFRHGGFTEGADSDLSDAELRAAGRHWSARQLPTYAKRTRKQLMAGVQKRRAERTKPAGLSE
jgi:hypothetical protein